VIFGAIQFRSYNIQASAQELLDFFFLWFIQEFFTRVFPAAALGEHSLGSKFLEPVRKNKKTIFELRLEKGW
jgi:hypothetical protein